MFFSKQCFSNPSSTFLEVCLNLESMLSLSPVYNFNAAWAIKKVFSAGVEITATLTEFDKPRNTRIY
jgi:hypothetical protein